jgi:hypothetical protein
MRTSGARQKGANRFKWRDSLEVFIRCGVPAPGIIERRLMDPQESDSADKLKAVAINWRDLPKSLRH